MKIKVDKWFYRLEYKGGFIVAWTWT